MNRREVIAGLGGAAAWPVAARAQQGPLVRQIGVLTGPGAENDAAVMSNIAAFREGMAKLGWSNGRNLRIDLRFGSSNFDRNAVLAAELVRLGPDVIVTESAVATRAVQQWTQSIPIVIAGAGDVVANGLVKSLTRPEGNITGVTNLFVSIGGKWLELLEETSPAITRVALIESEIVGIGGESPYLPSIREAALALNVQIVETRYRSGVDIVRGVDAFASEREGALIILPPSPTPANREIIFQLASQHRLPTIGFLREFAAEGCLMTYGSQSSETWRRAAVYVDRILRGAKVGELPVEFPTKFDLVINLKTAKALGLIIPQTLLATADEVIQ
jgi:putative tryptophan/tyrosine transport system substrate-binding protein